MHLAYGPITWLGVSRKSGTLHYVVRNPRVSVPLFLLTPSQNLVTPPPTCLLRVVCILLATGHCVLMAIDLHTKQRIS